MADLERLRALLDLAAVGEPLGFWALLRDADWSTGADGLPRASITTLPVGPYHVASEEFLTWIQGLGERHFWRWSNGGATVGGPVDVPALIDLMEHGESTKTAAAGL